jgi:hypothetical protein
MNIDMCTKFINIVCIKNVIKIERGVTFLFFTSTPMHDKSLCNVVPLICECLLKLVNRFKGINSSTDASSKLNKCSMGFKSGDNASNLKIVVGNLNGIGYRDEILAPIVLPFIRTHHFNHVFQQDTTINTHSSVAKFQIKLGFIRKQNVLPSVSPPPKTCTLKPSNPVSTF